MGPRRPAGLGMRRGGARPVCGVQPPEEHRHPPVGGRHPVRSLHRGIILPSPCPSQGPNTVGPPFGPMNLKEEAKAVPGENPVLLGLLEFGLCWQVRKSETMPEKETLTVTATSDTVLSMESAEGK